MKKKMEWLSLKVSYEAALQNTVDECRVQPVDPKTLQKLQHIAESLEGDTKEALNSFIKREALGQQPDLTSTITADICEDCGVQMMVIANDSMLACSRCAKTRVITSVNAWNSSMDADFSSINMHQKSRLLEWLEFAQAKEYGEVPAHVVNQIMASLVLQKATGLEPHVQAIKAEREKNGPYLDAASSVQRLEAVVPNIEALLRSLDAVAVRNVSKSSAETKKFAERSAKIASIASGYLPERLTADQEEYIRKLFMAACPVYDRWRKTNQPSWPGGYAYFLRCVLILLGWDEVAALFPIQLTGRNAEREDMRRQIWSQLNWEFVPSSGVLKPVGLPDGKILVGDLVQAADIKCKCTTRGFDDD